MISFSCFSSIDVNCKGILGAQRSILVNVFVVLDSISITTFDDRLDQTRGALYCLPSHNSIPSEYFEIHFLCKLNLNFNSLINFPLLSRFAMHMEGRIREEWVFCCKGVYDALGRILNDQDSIIIFAF